MRRESERQNRRKIFQISTDHQLVIKQNESFTQKIVKRKIIINFKVVSKDFKCIVTKPIKNESNTKSDSNLLEINDNATFKLIVQTSLSWHKVGALGKDRNFLIVMSTKLAIIPHRSVHNANSI